MSKAKSKKAAPSYLVAMQEVIEEEAEQKRQADQFMVEHSFRILDGMKWRSTWSSLEDCIKGYLNGESSRSMVDFIVVLNTVIEYVGFDEHLQNLRGDDPFPKFQSIRDKHHVAICKMVIGVWSAIRFDGADADELVEQLDANRKRMPSDVVGFVCHVIERGGLPNCQLCNQPLPPREMLRHCCEKCKAKDKTSLRWLNLAIESESIHGPGSVYTGGVEGHYPQWREWRNRLTDYLGDDDATDKKLWRSWVNYVRREHGLNEDRFWLVQLSDADRYLPPPATLLARESDNALSKPMVESVSTTSDHGFRPEDCDDDLWLELDTCIRAMEALKGGAFGLIWTQKIATDDANYLKNTNQLAVEAGWPPFVFPREDGLEILRINGKRAFCRCDRRDISHDDVGGAAVLSALRAWRGKRAAELMAVGDHSSGKGVPDKDAKPQTTKDVTVKATRVKGTVKEPGPVLLLVSKFLQHHRVKDELNTSPLSMEAMMEATGRSKSRISTYLREKPFNFSGGYDHYVRTCEDYQALNRLIGLLDNPQAELERLETDMKIKLDELRG